MSGEQESIGAKAQRIVGLGIAVGKLKKAAEGDGAWFNQEECQHLVRALEVMRDDRAGARDADRG